MFRDSVDNDDEPAAGIITETVGSYTDEAGNMVRGNILKNINPAAPFINFFSLTSSWNK